MDLGRRISAGEDIDWRENVFGSGEGTPSNPWRISGLSDAGVTIAYRDHATSPPRLVVQTGRTRHSYDLSCLDKLVTLAEPEAERASGPSLRHTLGRVVNALTRVQSK